MLRVTIDILPHGSEEQRETLKVIDIVNDCTGNFTTGNYMVEMRDEDLCEESRTRVVRHKRADGCVALVAKVLKKLSNQGDAK